MHFHGLVLSLVLMVLSKCNAGILGQSSRETNEVIELEKTNDLDNIFEREAPELSFCMGFFEGKAYKLRCVINSHNVSVQWIKNGEQIYDNGSKYKFMKDGYMAYSFVSLMISNISSDDVGEYELETRNQNGVTRKIFYITPVEACDSLMRCFENTCAWPIKQTCNSVPEAHCVVDMCSKDPTEWCMPKWFVGVEQVQCDLENSSESENAEIEVVIP